MRALGTSLSRRGFGYVIALTILVTFTGAAGMYAFESVVPGGLNSYGEALWWTAMVLTTMGSQHWPQTVEGRVLCVFLALYAFAVFGYVTATLATFFIGRDAENDDAKLGGAKQLAALREDIRASQRRCCPCFCALSPSADCTPTSQHTISHRSVSWRSVASRSAKRQQPLLTNLLTALQSSSS